MQVSRILFFTVFLMFTSKSYCQCYEGITDTKDIYVLYVKDTIYEVKYFSNFHGEYTPFVHRFNLVGKKDTVFRFASSDDAMSLVVENREFHIKEKFGPKENKVELKRKKCSRLKINRIPKERISPNLFPGQSEFER